MLHFIPIPCREMNDFFCLAIIHHILQDEIEVFAMHPLLRSTQGTCHHCYEVNTSASREISNCHFILFCVRKWTRAHDVNLSIPWWRNFCSWQNNLQSSSNLSLVCLLCWKLQCCCTSNCFIIASVWPSIWIYKLIRSCCILTCKQICMLHTK